MLSFPFAFYEDKSRLVACRIQFADQVRIAQLKGGNRPRRVEYQLEILYRTVGRTWADNRLCTTAAVLGLVCNHTKGVQLTPSTEVYN